MGHITLKQIFALTPVETMGMPDHMVETGTFDHPGMMGMESMEMGSMAMSAAPDMARLVHYEGYTPTPEVAAIRPALYKDLWYAWGQANLLSNMAEADLAHHPTEWQAHDNPEDGQDVGVETPMNAPNRPEADGRPRMPGDKNCGIFIGYGTFGQVIITGACVV